MPHYYVKNSKEIIAEYIVSLYTDHSKVSLEKEKIKWLNKFILSFLTSQIDLEELKEKSIEIAFTVKPIEYLKQILDQSDEPLEIQPALASVKKNKHKPWSQVEDQRLLHGILKYGITNWTSISRFVGNGRTRAQCSQRWARGLDPSIKKERWSPEELEKLLSLVADCGPGHWTEISAKLGNRSDVQCRYQYNLLKNERFIVQQSPQLLYGTESKKYCKTVSHLPPPPVPYAINQVQFASYLVSQREYQHQSQPYIPKNEHMSNNNSLSGSNESFAKVNQTAPSIQTLIQKPNLDDKEVKANSTLDSTSKPIETIGFSSLLGVCSHPQTCSHINDFSRFYSVC